MRTSALAFVVIIAAALASSAPRLLAQDPAFARPVMLRAGDLPLGMEKLYPSPRVVDLDGDGHLDLVIGDLFGGVAWAKGGMAEGAKTLAAEVPVPRQGGKDLKFHNW